MNNDQPNNFCFSLNPFRQPTLYFVHIPSLMHSLKQVLKAPCRTMIAISHPKEGIIKNSVLSSLLGEQNKAAQSQFSIENHRKICLNFVSS